MEAIDIERYDSKFDYGVVTEQTSTVYELNVCNPQKQKERTSSYVVYTVETHKLEDGARMTSCRRYSDFLWLHDVLTAAYPYIVVPTMPEKTMGILSNNQFDPELVSFRARELGRFIQRVAAHPVLVRDERFEFFLIAPWEDFAKQRAALTPAAAAATSAKPEPKKGLLGGLINKVQFTVGTVKEVDPDPYFTDLSAKLVQRLAALNQLILAANALSAALNELGPIYDNNRINLIQTLDAVPSQGTEEKARCAIQGCERTASIVADLAHHIEVNYHDNIKDYMEEIKAVMAVLERRNDIVRAYTLANNEYTTKRAKGAPDANDAEQRFNDEKERLEDFGKNARADITRVFNIRKGEFERVLTGFAQVQQEAFAALTGAWEKVIAGQHYGTESENVVIDSVSPSIIDPEDVPISPYDE